MLSCVEHEKSFISTGPDLNVYHLCSETLLNKVYYRQCILVYFQRRILQVIYIRTLLFSAYTDALRKIYKQDHRSLSDSLNRTTTELKRIVCATVELFGNLGLKQIKKKHTKKLCRYNKKIDGDRSTDYQTSILSHGNQLLRDSIEDLDTLVNELKFYRFKKCKVGKKLKLKKKGKQLRDGNTRRRIKTDRKNKKNTKNQEQKGQKSGKGKKRKNKDRRRNRQNRIA